MGIIDRMALMCSLIIEQVRIIRCTTIGAPIRIRIHTLEARVRDIMTTIQVIRIRTIRTATTPQVTMAITTVITTQV